MMERIDYRLRCNGDVYRLAEIGRLDKELQEEIVGIGEEVKGLRSLYKSVCEIITVPR